MTLLSPLRLAWETPSLDHTLLCPPHQGVSVAGPAQSWPRTRHVCSHHTACHCSWRKPAVGGRSCLANACPHVTVAPTSPHPAGTSQPASSSFTARQPSRADTPPSAVGRCPWASAGLSDSFSRPQVPAELPRSSVSQMALSLESGAHGITCEVREDPGPRVPLPGTLTQGVPEALGSAFCWGLGGASAGGLWAVVWVPGAGECHLAPETSRTRLRTR